MPIFMLFTNFEQFHSFLTTRALTNLARFGTEVDLEGHYATTITRGTKESQRKMRERRIIIIKATTKATLTRSS